MKRRRLVVGLVVGLVALALSVGSAAPAFGDPAFGPGNNGGGQGNSGPQDGKCHPPGAAPASAISDEQACTDAGGTYVKEQGTASCQFPVGKSDNVKTTSQKGSAAATTRR